MCVYFTSSLVFYLFLHIFWEPEVLVLPISNLSHLLGLLGFPVNSPLNLLKNTCFPWNIRYCWPLRGHSSIYVELYSLRNSLRIQGSAFESIVFSGTWQCHAWCFSSQTVFLLGLFSKDRKWAKNLEHFLLIRFASLVLGNLMFLIKLLWLTIVFNLSIPDLFLS